jgi:V/A-type H+/Na+-transporting ATPase subunit F
VEGLKFHVIGDADTVLGFRLAGVEGDIVQTADETRESLDRAFGRKDLGVLIMPERTAQAVRQQVDQHVTKATFPLIIEIPDILGPMEGRKTVKEMIRAAVGVSL